MARQHYMLEDLVGDQEQEERDFHPQSDYEMMRYGGYDSRQPWIEDRPQDCGCRGTGWYHSNFDTIERCPVHNHGQPCPEL